MDCNSSLDTEAGPEGWDLALMAARCFSAIPLPPLDSAKATKACMASTPRSGSCLPPAPPAPRGGRSRAQ
eukprot:5588815-Pyramimonas_sp.AAC.1